jgi:hypothetical protein
MRMQLAAKGVPIQSARNTNVRREKLHVPPLAYLSHKLGYRLF